MRRYLHSQVLKDLKKKMVIVTGPRRVGKTFLAMQVQKEFSNPQYLNYDDAADRALMLKRSFGSNADLLVFDEVHKMKGWKQFLKGAYDSRPPGQAIMVAGSYRLETIREVGESLAGCYLHLRLHPFSVKELSIQMAPSMVLEKLTLQGGFPEAYMAGSDEDSARWRSQYYLDLVQEEILEFGHIMEIRAMKQLLELLRERVGQAVSYYSLAEELQVSPNTVKKYIAILENLFIIFLVRPFHQRVTRALSREPKLYFYDSGYVKGGVELRLENSVACSLQKHVHYRYDVKGKEIGLHYLKTREGKEVDFIVAEEEKLTWLIEVSTSDAAPSRAICHFSDFFPDARSIHLVMNLDREETQDRVHVLRAGDWLSTLDA